MREVKQHFFYNVSVSDKFLQIVTAFYTDA